MFFSCRQSEVLSMFLCLSFTSSTSGSQRSVDPSPSSSPQKAEFIPSDGDSSHEKNGEINSAPKDAQPGGSQVEITGDTTAQTPTEELIQNCKTQPDKAVAEVKEEYDEAPLDKSSVEHSEGTAEVSADVQHEEHMQHDSSANENPEAVSPVEPAEQTPTNTTAEDEEGHADEPTDPANTDANVENHVSDLAAVDVTAGSADAAEVPAAAAVEMKLQEESLINAEPENATSLEDAGREISGQTTGGSSDNIPTEQAKEEIMAAATEVMAESCPETSDVAPGEDASLQESVPSLPDLLVESLSEPPPQFAAETPTDGSCDTCLPEEDIKQTVESAPEVEVEALPETPAVANATPGEEAAPQNDVQPAPDLLPESLNNPTAGTATEGSCDPSPSEQDTKEIVEATAEVEVQTLPETPAADKATLADEGVLLTSEQPVPDNLSESPAAETAVRSVECEVESASLAGPVLQSRNEEVVECEAKSADNTVVEQSVEPTPEDAADHMLELNIEDAVKPVPAADAEAVSEYLADGAIDLTDALDVEAPTAEAVPKAAEDPEQSSSEEPGLKQQGDNTNISEVLQKPAEELNSTQILNKSRSENASCFFCNQMIDGNTKLRFNEPQVICHPECLKCGACAKALGDLLTPMYLHDTLIHCGDCFKKALEM